MRRSIIGSAFVIALLIATLGAVPPAAAQPDLSNVEVKAQPVADGLWMLTGAGGNIGVCAGEDGVFLIDDQYAPLTEKIVAAIKTVSDQPVRFVFNTHWHGDHTGGNENLGKKGTLIIAHDNVRERMSHEQFLAAFNSKVPPSPQGALPVVTFNDTVTFHLNGFEIHAFHVAPAHTDGDSMVHFVNANVLHMGDTYFNGMYPFIDVSTGGSIEGVIAAVDVALAMIDDKTPVIPGHGPLSNRAELMAYRSMLAGVNKAVAKAIAEGKDRDATVAAKPTAPWDEKWGGGFIQPELMAGIVYDSLTKK